MKMLKTQSLLALGMGFARTHAFVAPAGVAVLRRYSGAAVARSCRAQGVSFGHVLGKCICARCSGTGARALAGVRMMSTQEADPSAAAQESTATKLYIGNLGWDTSTEDLQESFAKFGDTSDCYVVIDRATGESRGFGFVTFASEAEANAAVAAMNGVEMDGRRIRVAVSRPKTVQPEAEGTKLYVGNLGYDTTAESLEAAFSKCGSITDLTIVTDRDTGNSRGFGFVTFSSAEAAQAAAESMDGTELDGREIRVNVSRPKGERANNFGGDSFGGQRGGNAGPVDSTKLFVGNLGWDTTSDDLANAFSQYGDVAEAKVVTDRETGNSRGFGFVTFQTAEAAEEAIGAMDGMELDGRPIRVNISQPKKPRFQDSYEEQW